MGHKNKKNGIRQDKMARWYEFVWCVLFAASLARYRDPGWLDVASCVVRAAVLTYVAAQIWPEMRRHIG